MRLLLAFVVALPLLAQQGLNFYSVEKEHALGQHLASEIKQQSRPLDSAVADEYVQRLGGHLEAHLDERLFPYSFEVIATTARTEPMALPGGYVLIPARFFLAVEDEDEFAGVLAHSLGHIALRHATRMATRGEVANIVSIPILYVGGWMGSHADSQRPGISQPLAIVQFQRRFELEADAFGLELAARAGYPAAALRRYIERTQTAGSRFSSPLPARDLRLARMEDLPQTGPGVPFYSPEEFQQIREMIRDAVGPLEQAQQRPAPTLRR